MECFERAIAAAQNSDQKSRVLLELAAMQDSRNLREDAIATLERLLALGPATQWHVTAAERLGRLRQARGQLDRALRAYEALEKLPGIGSWQLPRPGRKSRDDEPREVRKAEARDLRHEPPLPEE